MAVIAGFSTEWFSESHTEGAVVGLLAWVAPWLAPSEMASFHGIVRKGAHLVLFKPVHPSEIVRQLQDTSDEDEPVVTPTLARAEWEHISRVLMDCKGNVSEAARRLGILRQSLQRRLRKHAPPQ